MRDIKPIKMALIASTLAFSPPVLAGSVAGFGGSTEVTQILNNIQLAGISGTELLAHAELVFQTAQQVTMIANQLTQIQNMITNTLTIPQQIWDDAVGQLTSLQESINIGDALSFSLGNLEEEFTNRFKDSDFFQQANGLVDIAQQYKDWQKGTMDTIKSTMAGVGLQFEQFQDEQSTLQQLQEMSQTNSGRMQAIQVGNQIASAQVNQMTKLRQLLMLQMQQQSAVTAAGEALKTQQQVQKEKFYAPHTVQFGNEERW